MNVGELISLLSEMPADAEVFAYDGAGFFERVYLDYDGDVVFE